MNQNWIAVWGCPISRPARHISEWMKDTTVRMGLFMTVSGKALRFHFSNLFGTEQAVITRATVSVMPKSRVVELSRMKEITFGGKESGVMAPGGGICSDEIDFAFEAGEMLGVSLYFREFTKPTTAHQNGGTYIKKWVASGDHSHSGDLPLNDYADAAHYPFLHTVDALCDEGCYSVAAFGDSITAQTWPDRLAHRLYDEGVRNVAVIRKAIGGSRVLREYPCASYFTYGPKGLDRFEREVVQAGVKKVFILHGINDIIHPMEEENPFRPITDLPTAEQLIEGLQFYLNVARAHGIEAYVSPILPAMGWHSFTEARNGIREEVNDWIRNRSGAKVLPFEEAVMDPENPLCLRKEFDSGDHLHPSGKGAQAMADSIPLDVFA